MLKQPSLGFFLTPSSPESRGRRYAHAFACPSLALYNNNVYESGEVIHDGDKVDDDDDGDSSVSSLESFATSLDDADFCFKKATCSQPPVPMIKGPGTFWEKANMPHHPKESSSTARIFVDRKLTPSACYVSSPRSSSLQKRGQPLGKDDLSQGPFAFLVNDASTTLDASFSFTDTSAAEVHVVPVATPIAATRVVPCCDLCDRKDAEIQKQLREIEELKGLVTQLVAVLGQSLTPKLTPPTTTATESQCPSPFQQQQAGKAVTVDSKDQGTQTSLPLPDTTPHTPLLPEPDDKSRGPSQSTGAVTSIMETVDKSRGSSQRTMLRLCRLKQLKEESRSSSAAATQPTLAKNGKRHVYVSVGGNWGYYCGPALEQNVSLQGCVVRFDNGDLYLGDMMCYVPSTSFFSDEHGLRFHGRGALYRKDGTILRGLFHKHQLIE